MGQYDEQLKKQAQKRKSGNADYGLYLKKNKDGTYSDNGRGKRKTSEDKAAYQSGEKKAPKSKLKSNVDDVLANARFVIDDPTVSFGSFEFDKNAFNRAAEKQKKWWEDTGSTHSKYGYNMFDPEDALRAQEGRYSKAYEASFGKDELSQWLMANGQASGDYFLQDYNEAAYEIMQEQQKAANLENLRKEAIYEAWTTADDYMNISGDDVAAAIQRLQLNNPDYADIEIVNPKINVDEPDYSDYASPALAEQTAAEKDAAKREDALYLDDIMEEIDSMKARQTIFDEEQEKVRAAEQEANDKADMGIIDAAIAESGFSAEIDSLQGLARDSRIDEYNSNRILKESATDKAVEALSAKGYTATQIMMQIRRDGRLSYADSAQGKENEADRIQRRDSADAVLDDILSQGSPESQAAIERARKVGSGNNVMGTALREGFSPISMLSLTDEEIAYKDAYMDAVRTELAAQGFGDLEIDNAFRRADLEQYLDKDVARENYIRYVMGELGYDAEYTEAFIEKELSTDEGKAHYDKEMLASEFVENSTIDQIGNSISMIPVRAALDIVSSGVAAVDMVAANITGRKEMWQFTQDIEAEAAWAAAFSHDRNHEGLSLAADLGAEIVRMWATAQMGTKLAAGATKISPKTKGFSHLFNFIGKNGDKIPFVSNAMGSYYSEAMNQGANVKDATMYAIPAGLIEGMLESLEMGQVMQNSIGINFVGKKIAASGLPQSFKQLAVTKGLPFINFALDVLGEGIEEGVSALNASMLRTSTWDETHSLEMSDVWQSTKGGFVLGGIMGGFSMPAHSQAYKYANAIYKDTGSLAKYLDSLQSAMYIENMDETRRNDLLDNVETTEITDTDRENFINATVEIHNLTENIAAKKAAVEAAEQDAAVKVEAAEQKVADYKKRISVLRENNGKKKADKIKELSAQLNSAQKSAEQIRSESAKKVETAIADYKAIAAKANATIAKNQELIDKYHAAKYTADLEADIDSDIDSVGNAVEESEYMERVASINALLEAERAKLVRLPQQQGKAALRRKEKIAQLEQRLASATDKYNASVAARTAEPTENTTAPINAAESRIDTVKTDVTEVETRRKELQDEIMRKSLLLQDLEYKAEVNETTEYDEQIEVLGIELEELETELERLELEVEKQYNNNINGGITDGAAGKENGATENVSGRDRILVSLGQSPNPADARTDAEGRVQQGVHSENGEVFRIIANQREELASANIPDLGLAVTDDHAKFVQALEEAKAANPHGAAVDSKSEEDLNGATTLTNNDFSATVAIKPDGDIVAVSKNSAKNKTRHAGRDLIISAMAAGGKKLDCYGIALVNTYAFGGMIPVARTPYTYGINPAMDELVKADIANGIIPKEPDIYFMMRPSGYDPSKAAEYARNAHTYTQEELDALEPMDYETAEKVRNDMLEAQEREEQAAQGSSAAKAEASEVDNPALKDLGANTPSPAEMVQSKLYTNTYDKLLTDAEKLADTTGNAWYARSKEKKTLADAKEIVRSKLERDGNLDNAMYDLEHDFDWDATDVDTAMLIDGMLRAEAATTGNYEKVNAWKNVIKLHVNQYGKAIQALAKWTRNSSTAAETAIEKAVDKINKANEKKIGKGKTKPVEVDPALLTELQNAKTDAERSEIVGRIAADIGAKTTLSFADKLNAWRYLAMLGNPRTIVRNFVGNELMQDLLWTGKDAVGVMLESGLDQSQRTKSLMFGETYKANRDYAASTLGEAKVRLEGDSKYDTRTGIQRLIAENTPVFKLKNVEGARKLTNKALHKGDTIFLERQYKRSFAQVMTARGYTAETITDAQKKECMDYAIAEAQRVTFHDASKVATLLSAIENRNAFTKIAVGGIMPFKKTPINVLARGAEFSPIGLFEGTYQLLTQVRTGKASAAEAIDKLASGLTGSALMAVGYFLAKSGIIFGNDEDEDMYYMSDLGHQGFSLNIGNGKSLTIDWAAPASIPLFMGAAISDLVEAGGAEGENPFDVIINTFSSITDPLIEMSMLQGLQDALVEAIDEKSAGSFFGKFIKGTATSYATSFIPTSFGQVARTIDPVRRNTSGDPTSAMGKELDKIANKVQAKIPGLASQLDPYVSVWGEQEINESSWPVRLFQNAISPGYVDKVDMTPVDVELVRLYSETQDPKAIPNNYPERTIEDNKTGESYTLNNEEFTAFRMENGQAMYTAALDAINSPMYSRLDDDEKVEYIADAMDKAVSRLEKQYKKKYLGK